MIRFIMHLLGREYEPCKTCEVLKLQLEIANKEREDLQNSIINLLKPNVVVAPVNVDSTPIRNTVTSFTHKRRMLEQESKQRARALDEFKKREEEAKELVPTEKLEEELLGNAVGNIVDTTDATIQEAK